MKTIFKKSQLLIIVTSVFVVSLFFGASQEIFAQTGESIVKCGYGPDISSACKINKADFGAAIKNLLALVISIGLPLLFIFVAYRFVMAWFALQQGNANAYKDALQKAGQALVGFLMITILIGGGLYTILTFFGVNPTVLKILQMFSSIDIFPHAYAQQKLLPNYGPGATLYEFILNALRLVMKFFIYPALIVIWVWTGFSFVLAQGAPEALTKAKKWLMWAFITTLVIMVLQGFLYALRNSVNKIIGNTAISYPVDRESVYN